MSDQGQPPRRRVRRRPQQAPPTGALANVLLGTTSLQRAVRSAAADAADSKRTAAFIEWLREKWGDPAPPCPYCGTQHWTVGEQLVELRPVRDDIADGSYPVFTVSCDNCGQTVFIALEHTGL